MACINMFNPDHQQSLSMSPRISFSNDFALDPPPPAPPTSAPRNSDQNFEFSVGSRPMIAADELFFKGKMLPLRGGESGNNGDHRVTTLRDELRAGEEDGGRPPKPSAMRWKGFLGLKKGGSSSGCGAGKKEAVSGKEQYCSDGGAEAKDVEMGL